MFIFFKYSATTKSYTYSHTRSLHDALPIVVHAVDHEMVERRGKIHHLARHHRPAQDDRTLDNTVHTHNRHFGVIDDGRGNHPAQGAKTGQGDRKSTRLNSSH